MIWMMLIMFLPIFGVVLFFILPLAAAMPLYFILVAISALYHCLMMGAQRLPSRMGPEKMVGSRASVRNWHGNTGQVLWQGEIWQASTLDGSGLSETDDAIIDGRSGLTLFVKPAGGVQTPERAKQDAANNCGRDWLTSFAHPGGWVFQARSAREVFYSVAQRRKARAVRA